MSLLSLEVVPKDHFPLESSSGTPNAGFRGFRMEPKTNDKSILEGQILVAIGKPLKEPKIQVEFRGETCKYPCWNTFENLDAPRSSPNLPSQTTVTRWTNDRPHTSIPTKNNATLYGPKSILKCTANVSHSDLMIHTNINKPLSIPFKIEIPAPGASFNGGIPAIVEEKDEKGVVSVVGGDGLVGLQHPLLPMSFEDVRGNVAYWVKVTVTWTEGMFGTKNSRVVEAPVNVLCAWELRSKLSSPPRPLLHNEPYRPDKVTYNLLVPRQVIRIGEPLEAEITILRMPENRYVKSLEVSVVMRMDFRGVSKARISCPPLAQVKDLSWEESLKSYFMDPNQPFNWQRVVTLFPDKQSSVPTLHSPLITITHYLRVEIFLDNAQTLAQLHGTPVLPATVVEVPIAMLPADTVLMETTNGGDVGKPASVVGSTVGVAGNGGSGDAPGVGVKAVQVVSGQEQELMMSQLKVWADFEPRFPDEVELRIGHIVELSMVHDDGWAFGTNVTTSKSGMLPLAVLTQDPTLPSTAPKQRSSEYDRMSTYSFAHTDPDLVRQMSQTQIQSQQQKPSTTRSNTSAATSHHQQQRVPGQTARSQSNHVPSAQTSIPPTSPATGTGAPTGGLFDNIQPMRVEPPSYTPVPEELMPDAVTTQSTMFPPAVAPERTVSRGAAVGSNAGSPINGGRGISVTDVFKANSPAPSGSMVSSSPSPVGMANGSPLPRTMSLMDRDRGNNGGGTGSTGGSGSDSRPRLFSPVIVHEATASLPRPKGPPPPRGESVMQRGNGNKSVTPVSTPTPMSTTPHGALVTPTPSVTPSVQSQTIVDGFAEDVLRSIPSPVSVKEGNEGGVENEKGGAGGGSEAVSSVPAEVSTNAEVPLQVPVEIQNQQMSTKEVESTTADTTISQETTEPQQEKQEQQEQPQSIITIPAPGSRPTSTLPPSSEHDHDRNSLIDPDSSYMDYIDFYDYDRTVTDKDAIGGLVGGLTDPNTEISPSLSATNYTAPNRPVSMRGDTVSSITSNSTVASLPRRISSAAGLISVGQLDEMKARRMTLWSPGGGGDNGGVTPQPVDAVPVVVAETA
ncbi:hypothetical protein HDU76_004881, partial [Blyttiomyces sp. JEL0837]